MNMFINYSNDRLSLNICDHLETPYQIQYYYQSKVFNIL